MLLSFLDRDDERARLKRLLALRHGTLAVLCGRRRCGKSRLLQQALPARRCVYYVGDDREGTLQRASLAQEIAGLIPGFDAVTYPQWDSLIARWYEQAQPGTVLVLDEFPALVAAGKEIPSLLQKCLDKKKQAGVHLILAGSSQRMMQGLVLDRTAPLFGRADEILKISPLPAGWIRRALDMTDPIASVEAFSVWGGVPRYWELAAGYPDLEGALSELVLSPLGVLRDEPAGLLLDDLRDTTQAASILSLIGQGCHRLSEIAARLGKPATSLTRPLQRLVELEIVRREVPFGSPARDAKRSAYKIQDPFFRFWFRFVEPGRSRIESGRSGSVAADIVKTFPHHVSGVWEDLARASVARLNSFDHEWTTGARWWGMGLDGRPMEIDVVAESSDGEALLLGEAKWSATRDAGTLLANLKYKAENLPLARGRKIFLAVWLKSGPSHIRGAKLVTPAHVMDALR